MHRRGLFVSLLVSTLAAAPLLAADTPAAAPAATPPADAAAAASGIRLGEEVVPVRQAVALELDPRQERYAGTTAIELDVRRPVSRFRFHAQEMDLREVTLRAEGRDWPLATLEGADGEVTATAAEPIPAGRYTLEIRFDNDFDRRAVGLYRLETGGEWYAFTQFEAIEARRAFPCWDEPSFKLPWEVSLTVPAEHQAFANTSIESESTADGRRSVRFRPTPPLPSYLVAVAVGPFESVPIAGLPERVPGRVIFTKGGAGLAGEAVRVTPPLLAALEEWFGRPYPFEKLDLIAVPEYWYGAMENVGLITFRDELLLVDPASASLEDRQRLAGVVAHEIAHHWFGNLVTMEWWDDLWLNEAFAYWMDTKATRTVFPELAGEADGVGGMLRAMGTDSMRSARVIRQPVTSLVNLLQASDQLTNQKGEAVLRMVESWLGEELFRDGVRTYLKRHEWDNAVAADLWNALGEVAKQPVPQVMSSFLDQAGVPLVSVEPLGGGKVRLHQTRLLVPPGGGPSPQLWHIPVALRYPSGRETVTQRVLLTQRSQVVQLQTKRTPAWIHPNAGEVGYYRWAVPAEMVERLAKDAAATLGVRERVALLDHLGALVEAEKLDAAASLAALARFGDDPSPEVVEAVARGLGGVRQTYFDPATEPAMARWVDRLLWPALERIGLAARAGEPEPVAGLRPVLLRWLGTVAARDEVVAWARTTAEKVLAAPESVDASLAEVALAVAAAHGDAELFGRLEERFEKSTTSHERGLFLGALGSFREPALANRALDYVLQGKLRPQELRSIPFALRTQPEHQQRVFEWSLRSYDALAQRIPPAFMAYMPYYAGGCSLERLAQAREFFGQPEHAPAGTLDQLGKVAESVEACVRQRDREGKAVGEFLARATR